MGVLPQHGNTSKGLHKVIRAERLHDYNMHLSAIALMLPFDRLGETKSSGGLTRGRTRSRESVWVALTNQSFGNALANSSKFEPSRTN